MKGASRSTVLTSGERRRSLLVSAALCTLACCQAPDERVVTEVGRVAVVRYDTPLCAGDVLRMEELVHRVEDALDVTVTDPIPVFLYDRYADVTDRCWPGVAGCYTDGEVHTLWQALEHELVHAVDSLLGTPAPFWSEGMAEALSSRTRRGETRVAVNVEIEDGRDIDIVTAGHFVRWLQVEYGDEGLREIGADVPFLEAYGIDLTDAIDDYEARAPWSYPDWDPCRGELLEPTGVDAWELNVEIDCAEPFSTSESSLGIGATRVVDIERAGTYRVALHGGRSLQVLACQLEVLDEPPHSDYLGDVVREEGGQVLPTQLVGDEEHRLQLEPGRLLLHVSTPEGVERAQLGLELVRTGP